MIISLPQDFFSFIEDSIECNSCLENLFYSHFCGNHIVITESPQAATSFLKMDHYLKLSERAQVSLSNIISFSQKNIIILNKVLYYIRIESFRDKKTLYPSDKSSIIIKDLDTYSSNDSLSPCKLVCENYSDCDLYIKYFNILCKEVLGKQGLSIKMDPIQGGGSTTQNVFTRICSNSIGISILDSDHHEPQHVRKKVRYSEKHLFKVEGCREIENTIPLKWLNSLSRQEKNSNLLFLISESINLRKNFHLFFDYKDGITKKYIKKVSEQYRNQIISFLNKKLNISESESVCTREKCQNCNFCLIVPGFGDNILSQFLDYLNSLSQIKIAELLVESDVKLLLKDIVPHVIACAICYKKIL